MIDVESPVGAPWPIGNRVEVVAGIPIEIYVRSTCSAYVAITCAPPWSSPKLSGFDGTGLGAFLPDLEGVYKLSIVSREGARVLKIIAYAPNALGRDESACDLVVDDCMRLTERAIGDPLLTGSDCMCG